MFYKKKEEKKNKKKLFKQLNKSNEAINYSVI